MHKTLFLSALFVMVIILWASTGGRPFGSTVLFGLLQELIQSERIPLQTAQGHPCETHGQHRRSPGPEQIWGESKIKLHYVFHTMNGKWSSSWIMSCSSNHQIWTLNLARLEKKLTRLSFTRLAGKGRVKKQQFSALRTMIWGSHTRFG